MKSKITLLFVLVLTLWLNTGYTSLAQINPSENIPEKNLNHTAVIFSVDPRTNEVNEIFLKKGNSEQQLYKLKEDCYRCSFYLGSLEGSYKLRRDRLIPDKTSTLTINTGENLMRGSRYIPGDEYLPGAQFSMAGVKTTVIANQNGKFTVIAN